MDSHVLQALYNGPKTIDQLGEVLYEDNSYRPDFERGRIDYPVGTQDIVGPSLYFRFLVKEDLEKMMEEGYVKRIVTKRVPVLGKIGIWPFAKTTYALSDKGKVLADQ